MNTCFVCYSSLILFHNRRAGVGVQLLYSTSPYLFLFADNGTLIDLTIHKCTRAVTHLSNFLFHIMVKETPTHNYGELPHPTLLQ